MFTPLRFQSALASGGVALMPFVLMQFTFAHTDKLISINDFANRWDVASLFLAVVMLLSTLMHFFLILKISIEFMHWVLARTVIVGGAAWRPAPQELPGGGVEIKVDRIVHPGSSWLLRGLGE